MARRRGKFFFIWAVIACAALYVPFQGYLTERGYESADDFFRDLLSLAVKAAAIIIPAVLLYTLFFRDAPEKSAKSRRKN